MLKKNIEVKLVFVLVIIFFTAFLAVPLILLLIKSFNTGDSVGLANYVKALGDKSVMIAMSHSVYVSLLAAMITTFVAFILAYAMNCSNINRYIKEIIKIGIIVPMLLPSITYGFAIIYSFGKQGLLTKLFGVELFQIYGINGLLIGYIIYTLPPAFLILNNAFSYIDKKFIIVSILMGDNFWQGFKNTIVRPLLGAIGGVFVLSFILSFTDFGIPASIGGTYDVIATYLFEVMLGAIPDFDSGSVVAMLMLTPAVFAVWLLNYLERFNFHYDLMGQTELPSQRVRDNILATFSFSIVLFIVATFLVMFIAPFVKNYPYDMSFTLDFFKSMISSDDTRYIYFNSVQVAFYTAFFGTLMAYLAALVNVRSKLAKKAKIFIDVFAIVTNAVPGMVLGLAMLFFFNASDLKGTFFLLTVCNIIHFFTTPYLMAKNSLSKLNPGWETTGELMGDNWIKTLIRVIVPNSKATLIDMFSYYFINAMVTISAIIFLVSAINSVLTSKIKELQHYAQFNEIFVLSLLIFATNIVVKIGCDLFHKRISAQKG